MQPYILLGFAVDLAVVAAATVLAALHIVPGAAVLTLFGAVLGSRARNLGDGGGPDDPVASRTQPRLKTLSRSSAAVALAFLPIGLVRRARRALAQDFEPRHVVIAACLAFAVAALCASCGARTNLDAGEGGATSSSSGAGADAGPDPCALPACPAQTPIPNSPTCEQFFGPGWYIPNRRSPCSECGCQWAGMGTGDDAINRLFCCPVAS